MPKTKVRLHFPYIETGQVSVGYSTVDIVNHIAEIDGAEVAAIIYWQQTVSAYIVREIWPDLTTDSNANPFGDELEIGASQ